jgi:hypothetical protein
MNWRLDIFPSLPVAASVKLFALPPARWIRHLIGAGRLWNDVVVCGMLKYRKP